MSRARICLCISRATHVRLQTDEDGVSDSSLVGRRALWLTLLGALTAGAKAESVQPHLGPLLAAVAKPTFCVPVRALRGRSRLQLALASLARACVPAAASPCRSSAELAVPHARLVSPAPQAVAADDERTVAYSDAQTRLAGFLEVKNALSIPAIEL